MQRNIHNAVINIELLDLPLAIVKLLTSTTTSDRYNGNL